MKANKYWNFNVSHHGKYVCIVSHSDQLVGTDIVDISTRSNGINSAAEFIEIFKDQLTPNETLHILSEPDEVSRYSAFFIHWALKESYIKAIGLGLGFNLKEIEFSVTVMTRHDDSTPSSSSSSTPSSGFATATIQGVPRSDWRFDFFSLDHNHLMAVARGPLCDAITSYQQAAWENELPTSQNCMENLCPSFSSCFSFSSLSMEGKENDYNGSVEKDLPNVEFKTLEQLLPERLRPLLSMD